MKQYEIFKYAGGYGVALATYLGEPVADAVKYFDTKEEAETYVANKKAYDAACRKWEDSIKYMSLEEAKESKAPSIRESHLDRRQGHRSKCLQAVYNEWRKAGEDASEAAGIPFTWDCGEGAARADFTEYAGLGKEITFEKMLKLEQNYAE